MVAKRRKTLGASEAEHAKNGIGGLRMARREFEWAKKARDCRDQLGHLALAREYIAQAQDELLYGDKMKEYREASDLHQEMNEMFHQDLLARCLRKETLGDDSEAAREARARKLIKMAHGKGK